MSLLLVFQNKRTAQINVLQDYRNNYSAPIGVFQQINFREGGFERVYITPNGKICVIIQSPILYPTQTIVERTRIHRILEIDPITNATRIFAYFNNGIIGASGANRLRDWTA